MKTHNTNSDRSQESLSAVNSPDRLDECQLELPSHHSRETITEEKNMSISLSEEQVEPSHDPSVTPRTELVIDKIQDAIIDMESILNTCSEQLGSLDNICEESKK